MRSLGGRNQGVVTKRDWPTGPKLTGTKKDSNIIKIDKIKN